MNEFFLKIDLLGLFCHKVTVKKHIDTIFSGLPKEYESFITNFDLRNEEASIVEVESFLLNQEARLDKRNQKVVVHSSTPVINANYEGLGGSSVSKHENNHPQFSRGNSSTHFGGMKSSRGGFT